MFTLQYELEGVPLRYLFYLASTEPPLSRPSRKSQNTTVAAAPAPRSRPNDICTVQMYDTALTAGVNGGALFFNLPRLTFCGAPATENMDSTIYALVQQYAVMENRT